MALKHGLKQLNAEHYLVIQYLAQPKQGGLTYEQISEIAGCHKNSIVNWRKDPLFNKELKQEIVRQSLNRLPEVFTSLEDAAIEDRNAAAAKLILQAHDMLSDNVNVTHKNDDSGNVNVDDIKERARQLREQSKKDDCEE